MSLQCVVVLYFSKSALNPIIYGWKNQDLRRAFLRAFGNRGSDAAELNGAVPDQPFIVAALARTASTSANLWKGWKSQERRPQANEKAPEGANGEGMHKSFSVV